MKKGVLVFLLFITFGSIFPQAQDSISEIKEIRYDRTEGIEPLEFDKKKIEGYRTQKDFEYINKTQQETWWTRFKKWVNAKFNQFLRWLFGDYEASGILALFIAILPFLLLIGLLALIVWLFSKLNPGNRILSQPKESEVFISEEEELVKSEDLPALIKEAVSNGQFRLAVRYYYLNELRKLDQLQLISYEFQKTNKDYSEEIENERIRQHFYEITKLYEFIWYGSFKVSEADYKLVEKGFLRMEAILNSVHHE